MPHTPENFWKQLYTNEKNRWYWTLNRIHKYKKEANAIESNIQVLEIDIAQYYKNNLIRDTVVLKWCDWQTTRLVNNYKYGNMLVVVSNDTQLNASTTPNGLIILNKSMVSLLSDDEILAVLAHEYAHFLLNHTYVKSLKSAKAQKRNRVWAEIASGILAGSDTYYNAVSAGTNGSKISRNYNAWRDAFYAEISYNSYKRSFHYSREQEMQSDIVAFRFLEWIGVGGENMISALTKLYKRLGDSNSEWNDHPTFSQRIEVLNYLKNNNNRKKQ